MNGKFHNKKADPKTQYGILAVDVNEESLFGTCIMDNGRFVCYPYSVLWPAVERYNDPAARLNCPTSKLKRYLQTYQAEPKAMALQIKRAVAVYKQSHPEDFSTSPSESEDDNGARQTSQIPRSYPEMVGGPLSNTPKVNQIDINLHQCH